VLTNTESTARQYALRQKAIALGWPAERSSPSTPTGASPAPATDQKASSIWSPVGGPRRDRVGPGGIGWPTTAPTGTGAGNLRHVSDIDLRRDSLYD
jgi:hypothetical protein